MSARISEHFTLDEFVTSSTASSKRISNEPDVQSILNISSLVHNVLEPLRKAMRQEIVISSGYRSRKLNIAVGGSSGSQHLTGQAADLSISGDKSKGWTWFEYIRDHLDYDQLIMEHDSHGTYWIHVSYRSDGKNRKQTISNLLKQ